MADINQTAAWVTARLEEVGAATDEGLNTLITNDNIGNYVSGAGRSGDYNDLINKPVIPTITNTYDATSSDGMSGIAVASGIADAKTEIKTDVSTELAEKADKDGWYSTLTSGTAEQLLSDNYAEDSVPYSYRQTGGGVAVGNREIEEVVGGSVVWNQLIENGNFAGGTNRWGQRQSGSLSVSDGEATVTAAVNTNNNQIYQNVTIVTNHVYFMSLSAKKVSGTFTQIGFGISTTGNVGTATVQMDITTSYAEYASILKPTSESGRIRFNPATSITVGDVMKAKNVQLFDLTDMFGSTIADYLYTLESGTAGAGVAVFRALFPKDYYATHAASIESVNVSAHVMKDANNNTIGNYALDSSLTLRGVPKLVDGKIAYNGDIYASDGTVTRKYGIVDLGTLTWSLANNNEYFKADETTIKRIVNSAMPNIACPKYEGITFANLYANPTNYDKVLATTNNSNNTIYIRDTAYSDAATFKTSLNGVYLVYELATATTETAAPYQNPQICADGGTEEYVDYGVSQGTRDVAIPCGHNTRYPTDMVKKLDGLPSNFSTLIAPTEATTTASQNYAIGSYFILNNTLYKVTSAIASGGTIIPNTNCMATTVMAELVALTS